MNQARMGLLLAIALVGVPVCAQAQGKKKRPKAPAAAGGDSKSGAKPADKGGAETAQPAPQPDANAPTGTQTDTPATSTTTPAAAPTEEPSGGGICEVDPSQCPQVDFDAAARRDIPTQMYAVQQIYALRVRRFELNPYWAVGLNDQFVSHPGPGLALNYYITNVLAIGVNGNYYHGLNQDSDFNAQTRRAARIAVPLTQYDWSAALNFTYVPMYGKFAGFGDFIFHYDAYVVAGVGALSNRPLAVVDPDNRTFQSKAHAAFNAGIGLRIFFNRWFAAVLEVRDYIFNDQLENTAISPRPQDSSTWYGESKLTNNVQAQLGISVFVPFSWDYRLPK